MNDQSPAITFHLLEQLRLAITLPDINDFDALHSQLPFISQSDYEEYLNKAQLEAYSSNVDDNKSCFDSSALRELIETMPGTSSEEAQDGNSPIDSNENTALPLNDSYSSALLRIHVVDEAKRRSQDFHCAKGLLVSKMKFFAAHLTDDSKPDDVDISVQCDVVIFDWLMRYVHKDIAESQRPPNLTSPVTKPPTLEAANVISILISSDFLQMDDLVTECLNFIHANPDSVVSNSPANFNCISEIVLKRLAALFDIEELDAFKDKKDRLKSKLYQAKIEAMFTRSTSRNLLTGGDPAKALHLAQIILDDIDIPDAASLFQCRVCERLLTSNTYNIIPCEASQLQLTRNGEITAVHVPSDSFDINDYISAQFRETRSWRVVFWRLWGTLQTLHCVRCRQWFRCIDFSSCWTHPERPTLDVYPCCRQPCKPFDPFQVRAGGCRLLDHLTDFQVGGDRTKRIYELMLRFRDAICGDDQSAENATSAKPPLLLDPVVFIRTLMAPAVNEESLNVSLSVKQAFVTQRSATSAQATSSFDLSRFLYPTWSADLSTRLNQDNQRQADYRTMRELCESLLLRKVQPATHSGKGGPVTDVISGVPVVHASTASTSSARDIPGGFYAKIESQMRHKYQANVMTPASRSSTRYGGISSRQRPNSFFK